MLKALNLLLLFYTMTWPFAVLAWGWSLPNRIKGPVHAAFSRFVLVTICAAAINALLYVCVVLANNPDKYFN